MKYTERAVNKNIELVSYDGGVSYEPRRSDGTRTDDLTRTVPQGQPFARDVADRMRVIFDPSSTATVTSLNLVYWLNGNLWAGYYSTGAPMSMDAREQQQLQSHMAMQTTRSRWSIT